MAELKFFWTDRVKPESAWLLEHRSNRTSQCGEDGVLQEIYRRIKTKNKWCVDVGAWDGMNHSNTWTLIAEHGWNGVLMECNHLRIDRLAQTYRDNPKAHVVPGVVASQGPASLDNLLYTNEAAVPQNFDLLSIDIDGCDWHVWKHLERYRPRVVVVEFNPSVPNNVYWVQDDNPQVNQGSSLRAFCDLAKEKGYELACALRWNAVFVVQEEFGKLGIEDNSIDAMHSPYDMESFLFQCYDGTLVLAGCNRLIWKGRTINNEEIQVVPVGKRTYHD